MKPNAREPFRCAVPNDAIAMNVEVHFLPVATTGDDVRDRTVIVVDILRATTTMLHALHAGAREVIPCLEVDEARRQLVLQPGPCILGGERGGVRIEGFQLGNSPAEYNAETVAGKSVVMTTTNGTRALQSCRQATRVLLGAFVNFTALLSEVAAEKRLAILCAGTEGRITQEDVLFAGAVVHTLRADLRGAVEGNDEAQLASAAWSHAIGSASRFPELVAALRSSRGGRNLIALGFDGDIELAARLDAAPVIAELQRDAWRIRAAATDSRWHC